MDLCTMERVSCVSAIIVPGPTVSPSFTVRCTSHFFSVSRESTLTPLEIYLPEDLAISSSGRYLRKGGDERTHQIHIFQMNDWNNIGRHLAFRNYMRTHEKERTN